MDKFAERPLAVVTGGGRGIGRAIATALASEGYDLILAGRTESELEAVAVECHSLAAEAITVPTDLRIPTEVDRLVEATAAVGVPHLLVNNSGIGGPSGMLWELDPGDWNETLAVNVTGVFLCSRGFLPAMIRRGRGSIVNIGSITGKRPLLGRSPYAASKHALVGLTRTLALETGPHGIRVNLISPGFVEGPRIEWVIDHQAEARAIPPETVRAEFTSQSPIGRLTTAMDVAQAVVFLASDAASAITGADLNVNAGVVMY